MVNFRDRKWAHVFMWLLLLLVIDASACLLFLWAALVSYSSLDLSVYTSFGAAVRLVAYRFHGPTMQTLVALGILWPIVTFLPFLLLWLWRRKWTTPVYAVFVLIWLGEIVWLGFSTPYLHIPF